MRQPRRFTAFDWLLAIAVGLLVLAEVSALSIHLGGTPPHTILLHLIATNTFVPCCLMASFLAYLFLLPRRNLELVCVVVVGLALEVYLHLNLIQKPELIDYIMRSGSGLGGLAMLATVIRICRNAPEKEIAIKLLAIGMLMPIGMVLQQYSQNLCLQILAITGHNNEQKQVYDSIAYSIDGLLGFQPSFWLGQFGLCCQLNCEVFRYVYFWLPMWMCLAQIIVFKHSEGTLCQPLLMYALLGAFGTTLYYYFPIVGVSAFCGDAFPWGAPPVPRDPIALVSAPLDLPRNGMPSLHLSWILAAYWGVCYIKPLYKYVAGVLLWLTIIATFPFGAHYVIDLVIAVPMCLACYAASLGRRTANRTWQITSFIFGSVATLAWLTAMRNNPSFLLAHGVFTWSSLSITVILCLVFRHYLGWPTLLPETRRAELTNDNGAQTQPSDGGIGQTSALGACS